MCCCLLQTGLLEEVGMPIIIRDLSKYSRTSSPDMRGSTDFHHALVENEGKPSVVQQK